MGRRRFSAEFQLVFRLIKGLIFITFISIIVILTAIAHMTVLDIFVCILAFMPTGWGLLLVSSDCLPISPSLQDKPLDILRSNLAKRTSLSFLPDRPGDQTGRGGCRAVGVSEGARPRVRDPDGAPPVHAHRVPGVVPLRVGVPDPDALQPGLQQRAADLPDPRRAQEGSRHPKQGVDASSVHPSDFCNSTTALVGSAAPSCLFCAL